MEVVSLQQKNVDLWIEKKSNQPRETVVPHAASSLLAMSCRKRTQPALHCDVSFAFPSGRNCHSLFAKNVRSHGLIGSKSLCVNLARGEGPTRFVIIPIVSIRSAQLAERMRANGQQDESGKSALSAQGKRVFPVSPCCPKRAPIGFFYLSYASLELSVGVQTQNG